MKAFVSLSQVRGLLYGVAMGAAFFLHAETESVWVRIHVPPVRGILTETSEWATAPSRVVVVDGTRRLNVPIYRNSTSRPFRITRGADLVLKTMVRTDGDEGDSTLNLEEAPFLLASIPEDATAVLLVVEPGDGEAPGVPGYRVYDMSEESTPKGRHTFLNLLENPAQIRMNDREWLVEPGARVHMEGDGNLRSRVFVQEIDGGGGRRLTSAVFARENSGVLHVLSPDARSARRIHLASYFGGGPDAEEILPMPEAGEVNGKEESEDGGD